MLSFLRTRSSDTPSLRPPWRGLNWDGQMLALARDTLLEPDGARGSVAVVAVVIVAFGCGH